MVSQLKKLTVPLALLVAACQRAFGAKVVALAIPPLNAAGATAARAVAAAPMPKKRRRDSGGRKVVSVVSGIGSNPFLG
jgi:hypothetical protein